MGLFLASKLTRLALGAAQTALAAGEAYRTGKKIEKRVNYKTHFSDIQHST